MFHSDNSFLSNAEKFAFCQFSEASDENNS